MATPIWLGSAPAIAQVNTYTFTVTWIVGETITITIGSKAYVYTLTSSVIATFLPLLAAALNALDSTTYPEMAEITWASTATTITGTSDSAGKPFVATFSTNSAAGLISGAASSTGTATTASAGPYHWDTAANWSTGSVPANGDTAIIDKVGAIIKYGFAQTAVTLAELRINTPPGDTSFILGLPKTNTDGVAYNEYRADYLSIKATLLNITTDGGRTKINLSTAQSAISINRLGAGLETGIPSCLLLGTHASNAFESLSGTVGLAFFAGEVSTALTLTVGRKQNGVTTSFICGSGCTIGTMTKYIGNLEVNGAISTAITVQGGKTIINGTGAVVGLTARGENVIYNSTGALNAAGNVVLSGGSILDFSQDNSAKTCANPIKCYDTSFVNDPNKVVSSLAVNYVETGLAGFGVNMTLTRT